MASIIQRGSAVGKSNPLLATLIRDGGLLKDPFALQYQILDASTDELRAAPAVVFPVPSDDPDAERATVDLVEDRLAKGWFAATWTPVAPVAAIPAVPADPDADPPPEEVPAVPAVPGENLGRHFVRWFLSLADGDDEWTWDQEFEVASAVPAGFRSFYCFTYDLREEGIAAGRASEQWLITRIALAAKMIDAWTGRSFEPQVLDVRVDGAGRWSPVGGWLLRGARALMFGQPIIAVDHVLVEDLYLRCQVQIDPETFAVYNRHLSQGLLNPDDRENPRIELIAKGDLSVFDVISWPKGSQNVHVVAAFGYTEPDGSPAGGLPPLLRHLAKLLVLRELAKMGDNDRRDAIDRGRIRSESTGAQSYRIAAPKEDGLFAGFTGDAEIDMLLAAFSRPPSMAAA